MNLVQRLTGSSSSSTSASAAVVFTTRGDISPAARLASIEKISPPEGGRERVNAGEFMGMDEGFEMGQFPGILSPAPSSLPPVPQGMFSPGYDFSLLNDMSPYLNNMFTPSPSSLLSAPMVSPSPSSFDILSQFFDF